MLFWALYLKHYEDIKQIFCETVGWDICHVVADSGRGRMDDADYDDDEVFVDLWRRFWEFCVPDIVDDSIYNFNYHSVCDIYHDYFHIQQNDF